MVTQNNRRLARVNESIREELSRLLLRSVDDPRLAWVTITGVEASVDIKTARVFYVVSAAESNERAAVDQSLNRAAPFLQGVLGKNLKLRYTPKLSFKFDTTFDTAGRIDALIDEVRQERDGQPADTPEEALGRLVSEARSILVVTHRNPDGDAVGSLLGFSRMLRLIGKKPVVYCPDGIPDVFSFLAGVEEVAGELEAGAFDLTVCLDTADEGLLPGGLPEKDALGAVAVIDHHATHGEFGDVVVRREASSVGEMLLDLQKQLVWPMDQGVAECLYTSIVADTGSFRYSNTTAGTHRAAAELIAAGARSWVVATALFESYPLRRQHLLAEVLKTLTVTEDGRFAELHCTQEMLAAAGATKGDLENVINFGRAVDTVMVAAMYRAEPTGEIKVSLRSKGDFDVAAVASRFDGGGHKNAAGCTFRDTSLEGAKAALGKAVREILSV